MSDGGTGLAAERAGYFNTLKRYPDAERVARDALAQTPEHPRLLLELAVALWGADRAEEALDVCQAAIAAAPEEERGYRVHALVLLKLGRHDEAIEAASVAVRLAPHGPYPADTMSLVLYRAGHLRPAYAEARRHITLDPHNPDGHCRVGAILTDVKDYALARQAYQEALRLNPEHALARNNLARVELLTGRTAKALRGFLDSGRADPTLPVVRQVAAVLWRLSRRLRLWMFASGFAMLFGAIPWRQPGPAIRVVAAVELLVVGLVAWHGRRALPDGAGRAARAALRSDFVLAVVYLGLLGQLLLVAVGVVTGWLWVCFWQIFASLALMYLAGFLNAMSGLFRRR